MKPIYPFIFAFTIVLLNFSLNTELITAVDFLLSSLTVLVITFLLWITIGFVTKNKDKSSMIVSVGLLVFFSYGWIYDSVDGFTAGDFYVRHSYLLLIFIIPFVIFLVLGLKLKIEFPKINLITNLFVSSLFVISVFVVISSSIYSEGLPNENGNVLPSTSPPDIYYVILDSYAHPEILKKVYNFDDTEFITFLKDNGFIIAEKSHSNYRHTFLSLSSSLNMKYLNYLSDELDTESRNYHKVYQMVDNNDVMKIFRSQGYMIINFASVDGVTGNIESADINLCEKNEYLDSQFLIMLIRKSILNPIYLELNDEYINERDRCVINELPILHTKIEKPIFVFSHILIPHPPYRFGPDGENFSYDDTINTEPIEIIGYLNQVEFTNKIVQSVVIKILESNPNSIIIIQSDTGTSLYGDIESEAMKRKMKILNAIYLPENIKIDFYDSITPVNTFRLVFNELFDSDYELLEDRMYWTPYSREFNFTDITNFLSNSDENE